MTVYVDETERAQQAFVHRADVLATVQFGGDPLRRPTAPWLAAAIPNLPLAPCPAEEVWPAVGAVSRVVVGGRPRPPTIVRCSSPSSLGPARVPRSVR